MTGAMCPIPDGITHEAARDVYKKLKRENKWMTDAQARREASRLMGVDYDTYLSAWKKPPAKPVVGPKPSLTKKTIQVRDQGRTVRVVEEEVKDQLDDLPYDPFKRKSLDELKELADNNQKYGVDSSELEYMKHLSDSYRKSFQQHWDDISPDRIRKLELQRESVNVAKKWATEGEMRIDIPGELVEKVVKSGRFKSTLEPGTGTKGKAYNTGRTTYELMAFGISPTTTVGRPIYGYMGIGSRTAGFYGDVTFVLKEEVRRRTTVTFGDSLNYYIGNPIRPSDVPGASPNRLMDAGTIFRYGELGEPPDYVEMQVHGGVTLDDVETVRFSFQRRPELVGRLMDLGIKMENTTP